MTVYGFNQKQKAEALSKIAGEHPPSQWNRPANPLYAGTWILKTGQSGIQRMDLTQDPPVPGVGLCTVHYLHPTDENLPQDFVTQTGQPREIRTFNIGTDNVPPNTYLRGIMFGQSFIVNYATGVSDPSLMKGYLVDCVKACDDKFTITVYDPLVPTAGNGGESGCGPGRNGLLAHNMLSSEGVFSQIDFQGQPSVTIEVDNAWKLDGITGSAVWFAPVFGDTTTNADNWHWEAVLIEDKRARWLAVQYEEGQSPSDPNAGWKYRSHTEGTDPRVCGQVQIECPYCEDCIVDGMWSYAFYSPEQDIYFVIPPPPKTRKQTIPHGPFEAVCDFDNHSMDYKQASKEITTIDCGTEEPTELQTVFSIDRDYLSCVDICWVMCAWCPAEWGYDPDFCDPCKGDCFWIWSDPGSTGNGQWILDTSRPNTCTDDPDCGCYEPPPYDPNNPPAHNEPYPDPTECGEPPPCSGECSWTYRAGTFNTLSGPHPYNYWERSGNTCTTGDPDCQCCVPPNITSPVVDQTYPVDCGPLPDDCVGECQFYWDLSQQSWNELPNNTCCSAGTGCTCTGEPSSPGTQDGQVQSVACGADPPCSGECQWQYKQGSYTTTNGATATFTYWENVGNNCNPITEECDCCEPPNVSFPEIDRVYPADCSPKSTTCVGKCGFVYDLALDDWIVVHSNCCIAGVDPCGCGTITATNPPDGQYKELDCNQDDSGECTGDCFWIYDQGIWVLDPNIPNTCFPSTGINDPDCGCNNAPTIQNPTQDMTASVPCGPPGGGGTCCFWYLGLGGSGGSPLNAAPATLTSGGNTANLVCVRENHMDDGPPNTHYGGMVYQICEQIVGDPTTVINDMLAQLEAAVQPGDWTFGQTYNNDFVCYDDAAELNGLARTHTEQLMTAAGWPGGGVIVQDVCNDYTACCPYDAAPGALENNVFNMLEDVLGKL